MISKKKEFSAAGKLKKRHSDGSVNTRASYSVGGCVVLRCVRGQEVFSEAHHKKPPFLLAPTKCDKPSSKVAKMPVHAMLCKKLVAVWWFNACCLSSPPPLPTP